VRSTGYARTLAGLSNPSLGCARTFQCITSLALSI